MAFFTQVFTIETWEQAKARGFSVTGFPASYAESTLSRVSPGDILLCYVKAPVKQWVGALRVESPVYLDAQDAVFDVNAAGAARFAARFRVTPVVVRDVYEGVSVDETVALLTCLREKKRWHALFMRSLVSINEDDGRRLLAILRKEPFRR